MKSIVKSLNLISPWVNYFREIEAIFKEDREVTVLLDEESKTIDIYTTNLEKAEGIKYLLPREKVFGNVTIYINFQVKTTPIESYEDAFKKAFKNNFVFRGIRKRSLPFAQDEKVTYAIFAPIAVQYYNDDIGDYTGSRTALFSDLIKDVFETPGVNICSENMGETGVCNGPDFDF